MICSVKMKMFLGKHGMEKEDCNRVTVKEVLTWPSTNGIAFDEQPNRMNVSDSNVSHNDDTKEKTVRIKQFGRSASVVGKDAADNKDNSLHRQSSYLRVELPTSTSTDDLSEVERALEMESAETEIVFTRPFSMVAVFSGLFVGSCTLDMSAVGFDTWPNFIWMPIVGMLLPFIAMWYTSRYVSRKDTLLSLQKIHENNLNK